ncbi:hypothetical protein EON68_00140 [archaeon]|nr:MAG: hypothetical protein EON68_00140 [archaeon]
MASPSIASHGERAAAAVAAVVAAAAAADPASPPPLFAGRAACGYNAPRAATAAHSSTLGQIGGHHVWGDAKVQ